MTEGSIRRRRAEALIFAGLWVVFGALCLTTWWVTTAGGLFDGPFDRMGDRAGIEMMSGKLVFGICVVGAVFGLAVVAGSGGGAPDCVAAGHADDTHHPHHAG